MKTKTWLALLAALALIALAAVAVGCGGDDNGTEVELVGQQDRRRVHHRHDGPPPGRHRDGQVAQKRADHAEVRQLADDIICAQKGEIATMNTSWTTCTRWACTSPATWA